MNYYEFLDVAQSATQVEIKAAIRIKLQLMHPDRHQGCSDAVLAEATRMTRLIVEAGEILGDESRRREYDISIGISAGAQDRQATPPERGRSASQYSPSSPAALPTEVDPYERLKRLSLGYFDLGRTKFLNAWELALRQAGGSQQVMRRAAGELWVTRTPTKFTTYQGVILPIPRTWSVVPVGEFAVDPGPSTLLGDKGYILAVDRHCGWYLFNVHRSGTGKYGKFAESLNPRNVPVALLFLVMRSLLAGAPVRHLAPHGLVSDPWGYAPKHNFLVPPNENIYPL